MKRTRVRAKGKDGRPVYVWTVQFEVSETWVEDGFELDDEGALEMLAGRLGYAHVEVELNAKVLSAPSPKAIARAQGEFDSGTP